MAGDALIWFRNDLRVSDNPALAAASKAGRVRALFIHETDVSLRPRGAASRWWLHHSLNALAGDLARLGIELTVLTGQSSDIVAEEAKRLGAETVFWNRRYAPAERELDSSIKADLKRQGVEVSSTNGHLLVEPWDIATGDGRPYSVYTPYFKALQKQQIAHPLPAPKGAKSIKAPSVDADYEAPAWSAKLDEHWTIGEAAAQQALEAFLDDRLADYPEARDIPGVDATSRLSPHLAFGEISARQVWHAAEAVAHRKSSVAGQAQKFLSELAWREFNYHQLYHRDDIAQVPMQAKYAGMPWRDARAAERDWQRGMTGLPIVDAGMRELWETGYMHNRVRMLTASLLSKNLLVDWRHGENWFWDCLVDADPANNPGNWQWVAGSGLDASPYFRIFNPVTQGERFDADGAYVRRWVPELSDLPDQFIHKPFEAPADVLKKAGVELGTTYPRPIVDLKSSRERALEASKSL